MCGRLALLQAIPEGRSRPFRQLGCIIGADCGRLAASFISGRAPGRGWSTVSGGFLNDVVRLVLFRAQPPAASPQNSGNGARSCWFMPSSYEYSYDGRAGAGVRVLEASTCMRAWNHRQFCCRCSLSFVGGIAGAFGGPGSKAFGVAKPGSCAGAAPRHAPSSGRQRRQESLPPPACEDRI